MDNNCVKYYPDPTWQWGVIARTRISSMCALWTWPWRYDLGSRSWHTLGSWTTILWNYIQIGQGSTKLWPGHDVNRRTDRQTDRQTDGQTDRQGDSYIPPPNFVCGGYNDTGDILPSQLIRHSWGPHPVFLFPLPRTAWIPAAEMPYSWDRRPGPSGGSR